MCVYLYIQNNYTHYTNIYYVNKHKLLFWMLLIAIKCFTFNLMHNNIHFFFRGKNAQLSL